MTIFLLVTKFKSQYQQKHQNLGVPKIVSRPFFSDSSYKNRIGATILDHLWLKFMIKKKVPDGPNLPSKYFVYEITDFQRIFMKFISDIKNQ